jgi:hypothetical protein
MTLVSLPEFAAVAVLISRLLTSLLREVRLTVLTWLALRGTQPDQRPEIIRALIGSPPAGPKPFSIRRTGITRRSDGLSLLGGGALGGGLFGPRVAGGQREIVQ